MASACRSRLARVLTVAMAPAMARVSTSCARANHPSPADRAQHVAVLVDESRVPRLIMHRVMPETEHGEGATAAGSLASGSQPIGVTAAGPGVPSEFPSAQASNIILDRKRILFVDDDPAILAGLRNLFRKERMRWDMVFALGGEEALGEARKQSFDVVVSDQGMPGIDGMTLLSAINAERPETALVLLSGYVDIEPIASALPTLQLLSKPCDTATLREAIERSIGPAVQIDGDEGDTAA